MRIDRHIRVCWANKALLTSLPCVVSVTRDEGPITVKLNPEMTQGVTTAHYGDHIVHFASGLWQRYGALAFQRLELNPQDDKFK